MVDMKRVLFNAILTAAIAFAGSAVTGSKKGFAPGQTGANPGQTFQNERVISPDTALSPGQQYKSDRANTTILDASPPGEGVSNYGRSKQLP
jgi:hypothetical protein